MVTYLILHSQYHQETIKRKMAEWDRRFSLEDDLHTLGARWKMLYYCPNGLARIKIDVLIEGSAELPFLDPCCINYIYKYGRQLPAAPLWLVLFHKGLWLR